MDELKYAVVRMYSYDKSADTFAQVGELGRYRTLEMATFWLGIRAKLSGLRVEGFDNDGGNALFGVRLSGRLGDEYWYAKEVQS